MNLHRPVSPAERILAAADKLFYTKGIRAVGVDAVAAEAGDDYGALMAATLIITLPLVSAFLLAQKRFVEGITMTGLKG